MLILMATPPAVLNLPNLFVKDSASFEDIPVAGIRGWDDDYIQTISITNSPCILQGDNADLAVDGTTLDYFCQRLSKVVASVSFSDSAATGKIRFIFKDSNDALILSKEFDIVATTIMNSTYYLGEQIICDLNGAKKVQAVVTSISAGTVKIMLAGV